MTTKKTEIIRFRVTEIEKATIYRAAETRRDGIASRYIRNMVLSQAKIDLGRNQRGR